MLLTAGSGVALIEEVGMVAAHADTQVDATCLYAEEAAADACRTAIDVAEPLAAPAFQQANGAFAFASQSAGAAGDFAGQLGADAATKVQVVGAVATTVASNLAGQASAAADLATSVAENAPPGAFLAHSAANLVATGNAVLSMEAEALLSNTALVEVLLSNAIFVKSEGEAIAYRAIAGAPTDPSGAGAEAVVDAAALGLSVASDKQAAVRTWLNAFVEA